MLEAYRIPVFGSKFTNSDFNNSLTRILFNNIQCQKKKQLLKNVKQMKIVFKIITICRFCRVNSLYYVIQFEVGLG